MTPWTVDLLDQSRRLYAEGKSSGEIAKLFGLTRNQVMGVVKRRGWKGGVSRSEAGRRGAIAVHGKARPQSRKPSSVIRPKAVGHSAHGRATKPRPLPPSFEPTGPGVRLLDLQPRHCRWPVGEASGAQQLFCAEAKAVESSYCRYHAARARGTGTPGERRAASI